MTNLEKQKLEREEKAQKIIEKIRPQIDEKIKEYLSKKLFKDLKTCCFIFEDQELTKKYGNSKLVYYRFNIEKMVEMGYEVVY